MADKEIKCPMCNVEELFYVDRGDDYHNEIFVCLVCDFIVDEKHIEEIMEMVRKAWRYDSLCK